MARIGILGRSHRLSFWRTVDGAEVNFFLETSGEIIPIEVKYTRNPRAADARHAEHFIKRHAKLSRRGFVICRAPRQEQLTRHLRAIPWDHL